LNNLTAPFLPISSATGISLNPEALLTPIHGKAAVLYQMSISMTKQSKPLPKLIKTYMASTWLHP
jgi:hypothetical protein